jgi:hypothetical protein
MSTSHRGPDAKQYCSMSQSKKRDLQATSLEMGGILSDCPKLLELLFMWLRKKRNQSTLILNTETHRFPLFCLLKEKCSTFPPSRSRIDRLLKFLAPISRSAYISVGTERNPRCPSRSSLLALTRGRDIQLPFRCKLQISPSQPPPAPARKDSRKDRGSLTNPRRISTDEKTSLRATPVSLLGKKALQKPRIVKSTHAFLEPHTQ